MLTSILFTPYDHKKFTAGFPCVLGQIIDPGLFVLPYHTHMPARVVTMASSWNIKGNSDIHFRVPGFTWN